MFWICSKLTIKTLLEFWQLTAICTLNICGRLVYFFSITVGKRNSLILKNLNRISIIVNCSLFLCIWLIVTHTSDSPPSPPPLFFLRGGGWGRGSEKLRKGGGSMVQGLILLKGAGLTLFLFNFFKVYHFLSCLKMNLKMSHKLR